MTWLKAGSEKRIVYSKYFAALLNISSWFLPAANGKDNPSRGRAKTSTCPPKNSVHGVVEYYCSCIRYEIRIHNILCDKKRSQSFVENKHYLLHWLIYLAPNGERIQ